MKILFITPALPYGADDSIWTQTRIIARALAVNDRHEVHLLSCAEGQKRRDLQEHGVVIHCRPLTRIPRFGLIRRLSRMPKAMDGVRFGLSTYLESRRLGIDLDLIQFPDWGASGWLLAVVRRRPLVEQLHAPAPFVSQPAYTNAMAPRDIRLKAFLEGLAIRRAAAVVASSEAQAQAYRDSGLPRGRRIQVIPEAIDWTSWQTRSVQSTRPVVLFAGSLVPRKAPEILVRAMSIIRKQIPAAQALFAGQAGRRDGLPYDQWMKQSIGDVSGCRFLGHLPRQRLMEVMSESRVFVMPSWSESFGLAAVEAMSAGRPVIVTTTSGGVAELVREAGGGTVVPPGDPAALAEALIPFLADSAVAHEVGMRAYRVVRERLDPEKVAAQREVVYEQAIRLHRGGRATAQATSHRPGGGSQTHGTH